MKIFYKLTFVAALTSAATLGGAAAMASELATFDLTNDPTFAGAREMLDGYAKAKSRSKTSSFCVLGVDDAGTRSAWIVWAEKKQLIFWEGQDLRDTPPRRVLDMKKDVVKSEDDLRGSTYRVTKKWADAVIATCREQGQTINVKRIK